MAREIEEILRSIRISELDLRPAPGVAPATTLAEVYRLLDQEHRVAVMVLDDGKVVGIFSQRDVLYRTALEAIDPDTSISELMTRDPTTLSPGDRLAEAVKTMTRGGFRQIPLVDEAGRAVGMVSSRDVICFIAEHFPAAVLNLPPRLHQTMSRPEGG